MAKRKGGKKNRKATGEGTVVAVSLTFMGKDFRLADKVGLMPMLKYAHLASKGVDSTDMEGLAVVYDLLENVIHDTEWDAFQRHATDVRADDSELIEAVGDAISLIAQRPTVRPSDSSDGPADTNGSSADDSSSRVVHRLEQEGRPSIALMVRQREQDSTVSA